MATQQKLKNTDDLTIYLKGKTHMTLEHLEMISDEGKQKMKECLDKGLPANFVADMFSEGLNKALQDHSMVIKEQIEEEIAAGNISEVVRRTGRDSYSYQKVVSVNGKDYAFDEKKFNSERQCRQWLKMSKINIKF